MQYSNADVIVSATELQRSCTPFTDHENQKRTLKWIFSNTVEPLISPRSRGSISTLLCHSMPFERPNEQGDATVDIESRDRGDMKEFTLSKKL